MTSTQFEQAMDRDQLRRLYRARLSKGRATIGEMFGGHIEVSSAGAWVTTSTGRRFLNCGGYGVFLAGARHPAVISAVLDQLARHPVATRIFLEPQLGLAADALVAKAPAGLERVHFACSGAEVVETAIKLARSKGKPKLVSMTAGYHGKTMGALSLTANPIFQRPFQPLLPDVTHVPYGDPDPLAEVLAQAPGECCVIVEPVQGEAGVVVPPPGYLREVESLCRAHGAFLVLDEVQTGMGRLGTWWGASREGVTPDVLLAGKGLGGGVLPVAAAIATPAAFSVFDKDPYLHTSTFSGAPLTMAAVRGALAAIEQDGLVDRAARLGAAMLPEIARILTSRLGGLVKEVRGVGLLIGAEFTVPGLAGDLLIELAGQGVIANHSLNSHLVLRLTPPAVLTDEDLAFLYQALDRACQAQARSYQPSGLACQEA